MKTLLNRIPKVGEVCSRVDLDRVPSATKLKLLNTYLEQHDDLVVRFFSNKGDWTSLAWASLLPALERLQLQNMHRQRPISSLEPLVELLNLREFVVDGFVSREIDFSPLNQFQKTLQTLSMGVPDSDPLLDLLKGFKKLRSLGVRSADFRKLTGLTLDFLGIGAGGATNLDSFEKLKRVSKLFLNGTQVASLDELFSHPKLQEVVLLKPKGVAGNRLPKSSPIKFLYIDGLHGLRSFDELRKYQNLRVLVVRNCSLPPSVFGMLNDMPALCAVHIEYLSKQKREAIQSILESRIRFLEKPAFSMEEALKQ